MKHKLSKATLSYIDRIECRI